MKQSPDRRKGKLAEDPKTAQINTGWPGSSQEGQHSPSSAVSQPELPGKQAWPGGALGIKDRQNRISPHFPFFHLRTTEASFKKTELGQQTNLCNVGKAGWTIRVMCTNLLLPTWVDHIMDQSPGKGGGQQHHETGRREQVGGKVGGYSSTHKNRILKHGFLLYIQH